MTEETEMLKPGDTMPDVELLSAESVPVRFNAYLGNHHVCHVEPPPCHPLLLLKLMARDGLCGTGWPVRVDLFSDDKLGPSPDGPWTYPAVPIP